MGKNFCKDIFLAWFNNCLTTKSRNVKTVSGSLLICGFNFLYFPGCYRTNVVSWGPLVPTSQNTKGPGNQMYANDVECMFFEGLYAFRVISSAIRTHSLMLR